MSRRFSLLLLDLDGLKWINDQFGHLVGSRALCRLAQIAADTLDVGLDQLRIEIARSDFGRAPVAGGSMGTSSWGAAVVKALGRR